MRKIKFRVWDKEKEKFIKNTREPKDDNLFIEYLKGAYKITHWGNLELSQYTGLKDSEGQEIYEGDIVRNKNYPNCCDSVVVYQHGCYYLKDPIVGCEDRLETTHMHSKVIGNKFENPDLIEEANND